MDTARSPVPRRSARPPLTRSAGTDTLPLIHDDWISEGGDDSRRGGRLACCGKQWQSCGLTQCAVQQEELPEAQRAARRGRSQSSGPRARAAASACAARRQQRRCNGEQQESERPSSRRNTPNKAGTRNSTGANGGQGGGTGPPRCLDNCANNTPPNLTRQRRIATV